MIRQCNFDPIRRGVTAKKAVSVHNNTAFTHNIIKFIIRIVIVSIITTGMASQHALPDFLWLVVVS
jgi:hypothetical protein